MLAQGIPSRYQWLLPSTVCIVGNRSVHDAGPLDVQRSGGSVKWESVSMILIPSKELLSSDFDSTTVTVHLRWSRVSSNVRRTHSTSHSSLLRRSGAPSVGRPRPPSYFGEPCQPGSLAAARTCRSATLESE